MSFWRNFHRWLHWKLSKWQLTVQPDENFVKMTTFSFQCKPATWTIYCLYIHDFFYLSFCLNGFSGKPPQIPSLLVPWRRIKRKHYTEKKYRQFDEIFVTGCNESCQNDSNENLIKMTTFPGHVTHPASADPVYIRYPNFVITAPNDAIAPDQATHYDFLLRHDVIQDGRRGFEKSRVTSSVNYIFVGVFFSFDVDFKYLWHMKIKEWCYLPHQRFDCLFNRLFRRGSKKTSKLRVNGLCDGNPPVTDGESTGHRWIPLTKGQ